MCIRRAAGAILDKGAVLALAWRAYSKESRHYSRSHQGEGMISLENIARPKTRVTECPTEPEYDHATQQGWPDTNFDSRKVYMKSSTMFDGERDPGRGDDR